MDDQPRTCELLVHNAHVLTLDPQHAVYSPGALAVDGGTLVAVGRAPDVLTAFTASRVIDARGGTVHPGFVDCHVHSSFHLTRGVLPDTLDFAQHARNWNAWWESVGDEDEYAAVLLAALELARNGVTTFMDAGTVLQPDAAAAAIQAVGIRGSLADPFVRDVAPADTPTQTRAPATRERAWAVLGGQLGRNDAPGALVRGHLALVGLGSASEDLVMAATAMARSHGVPLTMHQSFTPADVAADDLRLGKHALVRYAERDVLGPHLALSHVNVVRDDEFDPLARSGASVVWCPLASLHWGVSPANPTPHPRLHRMGVNICLGSDSTRYGTESQGYLAVLLARAAGEPLAAESALEMLTCGGARALGVGDRIGSLEPGKQADFVIHATDSPEAVPGLDRVEVAVLSARSRTIDTAVVNGEVIVEHGHATRIDEDRVFALAKASAKRMMGRLGYGP